MKTNALEPVLIKAIDGVAKKLGRAERKAESKVAKMLDYWNDLEPGDKERVVGIAVATVTTAVSAVMALKGRSGKPLKRAGKTLVRAVTRRAG